MNAVEEEEHYEILAMFPFTSETKRMGILVRNTTTGKILFYLKGAESNLKHKLKPIYQHTVIEKCD